MSKDSVQSQHTCPHPYLYFKTATMAFARHTVFAMVFALFVMSPISVIAEYFSDNIFPLLGRVLRPVFAQLASFGPWLVRFGAWLGQFETLLEEPEDGHQPSADQRQHQCQYSDHGHHGHKLKTD